MSKNSKKKYETAVSPEVPATEANATITAEEIATGPFEAPVEKKPRAPRIVRPRFRLVDGDGKEIHFTHYALPTRRAPAGKITIDGTETDFIVTKSQSKDKTEDRAYSYFALPNGATGYVSQELAVGAVFTTKELPPAEPFGRKPVATEEAAAA